MTALSEDHHEGPRLWLGLLHYPVLNRAREIITTAITNLDVHDIARAARTYNVRGYFVITPIEKQRELAEKIIDHWRRGHGAERVPERGEALRLVRPAPSLGEAIGQVELESGVRPLLVATCARGGRATISFDDLGRQIAQGATVFLLFGTGWGLADQALEQVDDVLEPIAAPHGDYNHLSVRCAASIALDRLLCRSS